MPDIDLANSYSSLKDYVEDGGSGVKEESKFDLLREMGGEREQGRKDTATAAVTSSLASSLVPSGPDILLLHTKDETSEPSGVEWKECRSG